MAFAQHFLASRFGKRTFGLLIVLVIAPVLVAAYVAIANLESELRQQEELRLHRNAKEYGFDILQRLRLINREASYLARGLDPSAEYGFPFEVVTGGTEDFGGNPQGAAAAAGGIDKPVLRTDAGPDVGVYMIFPESSPPRALDVNTQFLWGPADYLPTPHLCVVTLNQNPLYCSTNTSRALLEALSAEPRSRASFSVDADDRAYLGYVWELFLKSDFVSPEWSVYVFRPKQDALSAAQSFKYLFLPTIVALIAGALLIGVSQIRRRLEPLDQLVMGTQRVAEQDFSARLDVKSGDEFEDLAGAFNNMTSRLGKQVSTLKTLSQVDKTILKTLDLEIISEDVLNGLAHSTPLTCASITIVDQDSPTQGQNYHMSRASGTASSERIRVESDEIDWARHREGLTVDPRELRLPFLEPIHGYGARSCFAVPLFSDNQLDGILCVGVADRADIDDDMRNTIQDFADRLAVATAAGKKERLLQKQANFDLLTGLPNRFLLKDRLERALIHARAADNNISLLFLDLDRFKTVNDTLGHTRGDQLLIEAADRLAPCVRDGDTIARLGGDEFVILLSGADSVNRSVDTANQILERLASPFEFDDRELHVGASIGIAVFPDDGDNVEKLLQSADTAMYAAKDHGRNCYFFFDHAMNRKLEERTQLETEIRHALQNGEFELWYQPKLNLRDGSVAGAEALIRWRHPEHGIVGPGYFIPLAEELGLIESIGPYTMEMACKQYVEWEREGFPLDHIAVNVSPPEFMQKDYVANVKEILERFPAPSLHLMLEITENLLLHDSAKVMERLLQLKELGMTFAIDDFGIGYSSLSYLQKLPIDTLKIDRSFIQDVTTNSESAAIVSAILFMADSLNLEVIAEGVETHDQLKYLRDSGCQAIQGYLYSEPLPPHEFVSFARVRAVV